MDRLGTGGESRRRGETLRRVPTVNKPGEAVLPAARSPPKPQINRALPRDGGVSFGTVMVHKAAQK